jgi:hypothetical protein
VLADFPPFDPHSPSGFFAVQGGLSNRFVLIDDPEKPPERFFRIFL